ncbi:MAG: hypothetical protein KAT78_07025 [Flavobacteriaceae bacterium]|nr:hypothetical protein [Flavobacteriaceae bacterium]
MIRKYIEMPFVKVVAMSALLFLVVVTIFKFIIALFSGEAVADIVSKMTTSEYLISNLLGALVYGLVITFFYKRKYNKK